MKEDKYKYLPKFYDLETLTQEDLNKLALERNTLVKENERLNNIIKPKETDYNFIRLLFENNDKEEVIKSYVYKCEELEKIYRAYELKEIEAYNKDNRIDEAIKYINYMFDKANENDIIDDLLKIEKILKGSEEK